MNQNNPSGSQRSAREEQLIDIRGNLCQISTNNNVVKLRLSIKDLRLLVLYNPKFSLSVLRTNSQPLKKVWIVIVEIY
jgi:hypothetical protein